MPSSSASLLDIRSLRLPMTGCVCFLQIHTKSYSWPAFSYRQEGSLGWPNKWLLHLAHLLHPQLQCCHGHRGAHSHWILLETFAYIPTKVVPLWKSSPWVLQGWKFPELLSGKVSCSQSDLVDTCDRSTYKGWQQRGKKKKIPGPWQLLWAAKFITLEPPASGCLKNWNNKAEFTAQMNGIWQRKGLRLTCWTGWMCMVYDIFSTFPVEKFPITCSLDNLN